MRKKLALRTSQATDLALVDSLLDWMESAQADYTNTFRDLAEDRLVSDHYREHRFQDWLTLWQVRLREEGTSIESAGEMMRAVNPAIIPRNHRVEEALTAAEEANDLAVLQRLLAALSSPYELRPDWAHYQEPPPDDGSYRTFCGT